jgi:EAL domain-containing protein (putative c-di-GMP-specific phosphodiesterase class I)
MAPEFCPYPHCSLESKTSLDQAYWQEQVRLAIAEDRIALKYQRILNRHRREDWEVLARIKQPDGGFLPATFWIDAVNADPELSANLDWRVAEKALKSRANPWAKLWINFTAMTLRSPNFHDDFLELVATYKFSPSQICIEVTEQGAHNGIAEALSKLRAMGFSIAIDDVGAGHSNLNAIAHFPATHIKIDGALCVEWQNRKTAIVLQSVIKLGLELRCGVIAEWIESAEQFQTFWDWGVTGMQGFYIDEQNKAPNE